MCKNKTSICLSKLNFCFFLFSFYCITHFCFQLFISWLKLPISQFSHHGWGDVLGPRRGGDDLVEAVADQLDQARRHWRDSGGQQASVTDHNMSGEASPRHVTKFCRAAPHVTNTIEPPCMSHVTCFSRHVFFLLFAHNTSFFLSQRNLSFLHTMLVTRREKLFVLCTLRPPLPNWGLTRPPNMPKVSPVAHDDGLCTEDAPTGSRDRRPPHLSAGGFGEETTSQHLQPQAPAVAAARDARGKRKQLTLANSTKKLQGLAYYLNGRITKTIFNHAVMVEQKTKKCPSPFYPLCQKQGH